MFTIQDAVSLAYLVVVALGLAAALAVVSYTARRAHNLTNQSYLLLFVMIALTLACFLLHSVAPTVELLRFFTRLRFVFLSFNTVFLALFVWSYTGRRDLFQLPALILLFGVPFLTSVFALSPPFEWLMWRNWEPARYGLIWTEVPTFSIWFLVYLLHNSLWIMSADTLLLYHGLRSVPEVRRRALWIGGGILFGLLLFIPGTLGILPPGSLNLTPFGLTVLAFINLIIVVRFRLVDAVPIAHEQILRLMRDPVLVMDLDGHILDANIPAEALTGISRTDLLGKRADNLSTVQAPALIQVLALENGQQEVTLGSSSYDVNVSPITYANGRVYGRLLVFRDITDRKQVEAGRERMITDLAAYAHTVAHDLKNPLSLVITYADLAAEAMCNPELGDDPARYLHKVQVNAGRMNQIIDDMLIFATLRDSNNVPVEPCDPGASLARTLERLEGQIIASDATIDAPLTLPTVLGVDSWVEQVWINLISNAIKYGGTPPHIVIRAAPEGNCVRLTVSDNGSGLTAEQYAGLFREITRLEPMRVQGSGLGLTIVGRIVQKMHGTVGVESVVGEGSTFWFSLPRPQHPLKNDVRV